MFPKAIRSYLLLCLVLLFPICLCAQSFTTKAPSSVDINGTIRVQYVLTGSSSADFSAPSSLSTDFDVLNGPAQSSFENYQVINGKATSSKSVTYTYILAPKRKGTFRIPGATVKVGGKILKSQSVNIVVGGSGNRSTAAHGKRSQQPTSADDDRNGGYQRAGSKVTERDLYFTVEPSKRTVWEQEPIMLTYKFYSRIGVGLANISLRKRPELKGFWTQEIQLPPNMSTSYVSKGGVSYRQGTYLQYFIFPQQSGTLTIPGIVFDADIVQRDASVDMIDAFFNGAGNISLKVQRRVPDLDIRVKPLPKPKPADFSGGVGSLNMRAEILTSAPATNDVVTMRVHVSGSGNLKLLRAPKIAFPKDFDNFEPKTEDKIKITREGVEGEIIFDYTFVPRNVGDYTIPAVTLTYFDTATGTYKTLKSQPFNLHVKQGKRSDADADREVRLRTADIRDIHTGFAGVHRPEGLCWWGSWSYWCAVILILILGTMSIRFIRIVLNRRLDIQGRRSRRAAGRVAKQLRAATKLITSSDSHAYYAALDDAVHDYLTDKLSLPKSATAEAIAQKLDDSGVDTGVVDDTRRLLDDCAFARYAPSTDDDARQTLLDRASALVETLQGILRHAQALLLFVLLPMMTSLSLDAQARGTASPDLHQIAAQSDSLYAHRDYIGARRGYALIADKAPSADAYYNLGNAYYRLDDKSQAVLAYERALRLDPGHDDARHNLEILSVKLQDRWASPAEMFFVTAIRHFVITHSVQCWTLSSLFFLVLLLVCVGVYFLFDRVWIRKCGFAWAIVAFLMFVLSAIAAAVQVDDYYNTQRAVVVVPEAKTYHSASTTSKAGKPLHEGTALTIIDHYGKDWIQVQCPDGTELWIQDSQIASVNPTAK